MKLKEKYLDIIKIPFKDKGYMYDMDKAEQCEKIADEFAIGFAEWIEKYQGGTPNLKVLKELLEIYKKEKGL